MKIHNQHSLLESILKAADSTKNECTIICPFVKKEVLNQILKALPSGITLKFVTKADAEDVISGVNDPIAWKDIWDLGGEVRVLEKLHAKVYRFDSTVFLGSANLTASALGLNDISNNELTVEFLSSEDIADEISTLWESAIPANAKMLEALNDSVAKCLESRSALPPQPKPISFAELTKTYKRVNDKSSRTATEASFRHASDNWMAMMPPKCLQAIRDLALQRATFAVGRAKNVEGLDYCVYRKTPDAKKTVSCNDNSNVGARKIETREALLGAIIDNWQLRSSWKNAGSQLKRASNAVRFFFEGRDLTDYLLKNSTHLVGKNIDDLTAIGKKHWAEVAALPVGIPE